MTPRLPTITSRQLIQALKRAGFVVRHQKGSHVSMTHTDQPGRVVTIPHHSKDLGKGVLKAILRKAKMDVETLIDLL